MQKNANNTEKKNISVGAIISYFTIFVSVIFSFFYTRYILQTLGEVNCSIRNIATSATSYLMLVSLGMGAAYFRFRKIQEKEKGPEYGKKFNGVFLVMYIIFGIISLLLGGLIILLAKTGFFKVTDSTKSVLLVPVIGITVLSTACNFPLMVFGFMENYHRKFIFSNSINLLDTVLLPSLSMLAIYLLGKSNNPEQLTIIVTWIAFFESLIIKIIHIIFVSFHLKDKVNLKLSRGDFKIIKPMIVFSFFVFIVSSISKIHTSTDQMVLSSIINTTAALIYSYAMLFHTYTNTAVTTITSLFVPRITEDSINEDNEDLNKIFKIVSGVITILVCMLIGGFISCGREFVSIWLKTLPNSEKFDIYIYAICLMSCCALSSYSNFLFNYHIAKNKHRFAALFYVLTFLINIGVSVGLCYIVGIYGAIIGTIFVTIIETIGMTIYSKKILTLDLKHYFVALFINLIIAGISTGFVFALCLIPLFGELNIFIQLIIKGVVFILIFGILELVFNRRFIFSFIKLLFRKNKNNEK